MFVRHSQTWVWWTWGACEPSEVRALVTGSSRGRRQMALKPSYEVLTSSCFVSPVRPILVHSTILPFLECAHAPQGSPSEFPAHRAFISSRAQSSRMLQSNAVSRRIDISMICIPSTANRSLTSFTVPSFWNNHRRTQRLIYRVMADNATVDVRALDSLC